MTKVWSREQARVLKEQNRVRINKRPSDEANLLPILESFSLVILNGISAPSAVERGPVIDASGNTYDFLIKMGSYFWFLLSFLLPVHGTEAALL